MLCLWGRTEAPEKQRDSGSKREVKTQISKAGGKVRGSEEREGSRVQPKHGESDTGIQGETWPRAEGEIGSKQAANSRGGCNGCIPGRCLEHRSRLCLLCRLCEGWHMRRARRANTLL